MNKILRQTLAASLLLLLATTQVVAKSFYVTATATADGDGSSWDSPMTLEKALDTAVAGDDIYLLGYVSINGENYMYRPTTKAGFRLKSGVRLHGGCSGTGTERPTAGESYKMKYQSALVADIGYNDVVPSDLLIFPANSTRSDNAYHVLTMDLGVDETNKNENNTTTVVEGITFAAGSAAGTGSNSYGGGIYVTNSTSDQNANNRAYQISNCFFTNNYAQQGGAIYVDANVKCTKACIISHSSFFNNAAGSRSGSKNMGGAIWVAGVGTVHNSVIFNNVNGAIRLSENAKVVNCTVVHNTISAIDLEDGKAATSNGGGSVYNSLIWGNSALDKKSTKPNFEYCAYPEVVVTNAQEGTDAKHNLKISYQNFDGDNAAAWIFTPTSNIGYDRSFNNMQSVYPQYSFELKEQSALLSKGSTQEAYQNWAGSNATTDLAGDTRFHNGRVDIGAYERERLGNGRRLYVKSDGKTDANGTSWDDAMPNLQTAINKLYGDGKQGKGEVWVAAGTYTPDSYVDNATNAPLAFQMRDGISVIGGFKGDEESISERKTKEMKWQFGEGTEKYETILQGGGYSPTQSWSETSGWNITSRSYHVVWFAPSPGASAFQYQTILDGVTIQGGSSDQQSVDASYAPYKGAGVYMNDGNAILRNCVVKYNSTGQTRTGSQGGGVYCQGGQVRYSLVYNNSAESGGGVYLETAGFVSNSMITNNSAKNGAGVYLKESENYPIPLYQVLATSVVSNNTSTQNAAVYVDGSGLVEQNTIVNNITVNTIDESAQNSSPRTGGLYVTKECTAINNLIWNNSLTVNQNVSGTSANRKSSSYAQVYAGTNATKSTALFYNNGISDFNAATWNNITQQGTYEMPTEYASLAFDPGEGYTIEDYVNYIGVHSTVTDVFYYWQTKRGSVLRGRGMLYSELPQDVIFKPSTDILERNFESKPPIGAFLAEAYDYVFEENKTSNSLRLYFDHDSQSLSGNGSTWATSINSLSDILSNLGNLQIGDEISYLTATGSIGKRNLRDTDKFEICIREGNLTPKTPYTFQENEAKAKTYTLPATAVPLTILGGYPAESKVASPTDAERNAKTYRTEFDGNPDGSDLSDGVYHLFRAEAGANVTLDGIVISHGYAAGTANIPSGGAVLIGSTDESDAKTSVTLRNCILENNTASDGSAIGMTQDAKNVTLRLENCVVNNNTCLSDLDLNSQDIFDLGDSSNKLSLDHVTIVNNIGAAPSDIGTSSFAAGNKVNLKSLAIEGANNTIDIATLGADGAKNFSNPTREVGAKLNANVYYGGNAEFRPITSSEATGVIINQAKESAAYTLTTDLNGEERTLGGAADLGAYEALLPKAGRVIYVRSYNTNWLGKNETNDRIDGTPDFNLLKENEGKEYDGTTWDRAIMGNAICNVNKDRTGNDFYVTENNTLLPATIDFTKYSDDYNADSAPYGQQSNAYGAFFSGGTSGTDNGNKAWDWNQKWGSFHKVSNNRDETFVSGLQYAVEKAAAWNAEHPNDSMEVWVGAGVYTDYKGFVIRDGVKVYGGFKKDGNPGESDRHPLFSQYVPARKDYENETASDYETILQVRKESPVYMTKNEKELWWSEHKSDSPDSFADDLIQATKTTRHYVLYQPDVCVPTWGVSGDQKNSRVSSNEYRYIGSNYPDDTYYKEYTKGKVKWDGFTIRHGYITHYTANRDGGGGVRVFRGIELENLIIVNNLSHGERSRGGGLYMDGDNSVISNSYLLQNLCWGWNDNYGGGAYMIQGTGYNMVVASNRSLSQGGGIFIENAKFYNNTVAYNMSNNNQGTGIMHWQDSTTGIESSLTLYNCLVYNNMRNGGVVDGTTSIGSSATNRFNPAKNCYVNGSVNASDKFTVSDGNVTGDKAVYPFAISGYEGSKDDLRFHKARLQNDFRLNEAGGLAGNPCLNGGTQNVGEGVKLPDTDMDYTNRVKDCEIDIGAYEADNTTNITAQEVENLEGSANRAGITDYVFYVTQNGAGTRSGDSPANAACADKLQSVLTKAGELAAEVNDNFASVTNTSNNDGLSKVYVKVAGYEVDSISNTQFVYHANTLADSSDPQSYTFLIPDGVWLLGGYNEGTYQNGVPVGDGNWNDLQRNVTIYKTVLSAKTEPKEGSTVSQEVNGYHTVSFGAWPTGEITEYNNKALKYRATIDGVYITDGLATDNAGFKAMGGGAVVPRRAHVRNCILANNQAIKGGALMLLQGGMVSGSLIHANIAEQGGAIYASHGDDTNGTANYHAYLANCTIAENTANTGGGIYQELGALMAGNAVIWGNEAPIDKNISGVLDQKFADIMQARVNEDNQTEFYPFNYCFVERYDVPGSNNERIESDLNQYFTNDVEFYPRPYSKLVENGGDVKYQKAWLSMGVQAWDLYGQSRNESTKLTVGCYSLTLPTISTDKLLTTLYVSQNGGANISDDVKEKYMGRSFYTPFNSLDAALAYIKQVRSNGTATDDTKFNILISEGTYKPSVAREQNIDDAGQTGAINTDRRMQSFEIPVNVNIFGSFNSEDKTFSNYENDNETEITLNETDGKTITLTKGGTIEEMLQNRNTNWMADNNQNGLIEPWEFAYPTYFSGDIKASSTERKVYHVVYSEIKDSDLTSAEKSNDVMLDGITIMNGETQDYIDYVTNDTATDTSNNDDDDDNENGKEKINEVGHGGGIYSKNVSYTLNRCRILNNIAVHGAGVYVRNGSLDIINSLFAGNWAGDENVGAATNPGHGGAVCASFESARKGNLHAVNSIFVNNTAFKPGRGFSYGGAIFVDRASDMTQAIWDGKGGKDPYRDVEITNCIIANNNASINGGVHVSVGGDPDAYLNDTSLPKQILNNTILWNNEHSNSHISELGTDYMNHCAYNFKTQKATGSTSRASAGNILLSEDNKAANGPRFSSPTTVVGKDGFNIGAQWNPAAISVLTDAGDGSISISSSNTEDETGEYKDWWNKHSNRLESYGYLTDYIRYATAAEASTKASDSYARYMGAMEADGSVKNKRIDIGVYEFQYKFTTTDNEAMYVGTEDKGNADGSNWDNQTSDLRGAIIAMSHPTGNKDSKVSNHRKVYVKGGEYYSPNTELADAFTLNVDNTVANRQFIDGIEIVGACTGLKKNDTDDDYRAQDFSNPTVLVCNPHKEDATQSLLDITTNGKPVTISGFTFKNTSSNSQNTSSDNTGERGYGITAAINNIANATNTDEQGGKLTLANCSFLQNQNDGLYIKENTANGALIYNSLFADGGKNGITAAGKIDIANATFVNNTGKDIDNSANGTTIDIVNSVAWKNAGGNYITTDKDGKHNIAFTDNVDNGDVMNGPNFADPDNDDVSLRDYTIRPSLNMLNKGDDTLYNSMVKTDAASDNDLQNLSRVIGNKIDIGAYECNSDLLPIIYVNTTLATSGNGESWSKATNDMQSAINLAELYANTDTKEGKAYVFVNHASSASDISINLPGVYVYGGMESETAEELNDDKNNIKNIVDTLLTKRKGTLEQSTLSTINGLTMAASATSTNSNASIVDGFLVNGTVKLSNGYLSTSVLGESSEVTGSENGVLYNSLAFGKVSDIKAINVTAVKSSTEGSGTLPTVTGAANNRTGVSSPNRYLSKDVNYWSYQLEETDKAKGYINANENEGATEACQTIVGHKRDIAGNKRIREGVDKGCFETWYLTQTTKAYKEDYPHGKSVIYIAGEDDQKTADPENNNNPFHELILDKDLVSDIGYSTFSPGFVLLGHHAGLRGMGNSIKLDNFAVERELRKPYNDICVMPFTVVNREVISDKASTQDINAGFIAHRYSGAERANYSHKFDSTNSTAWLEGIDTNQSASDGMMLSLTDKADDKMTLRFYGKEYEETAGSNTKARLYQNNNQQPWSDDNGSTKFTAKENMGWNLFGSPYLCAMNYSDMEYGRVIYPYNSLDNKFDAGINTYDVTDVTSNNKDGFIPAFDAVFTQTATLEDYEYFEVEHDKPLTTKGTAYQPSSNNARIALSRKSESRAAEASTTRSKATSTSAISIGDEVYFNAVATSEAKNDFDMGSDGVKIMTTSEPQLYIERNGGRYSLLSAVNIEGSLNIGVSVPEAGEYSLSIPEDCETSKYETIWLKDKQTGKGVDLLEGCYDFTATEAGEMNDRFEISFNRMTENLQNAIGINSKDNGMILVNGTKENDQIRVYTASGLLATQKVAKTSNENIRTTVTGTVIVEVTRGGKQVAIRKIAVK